MIPQSINLPIIKMTNDPSVHHLGTFGTSWSLLLKSVKKTAVKITDVGLSKKAVNPDRVVQKMIVWPSVSA